MSDSQNWRREGPSLKQMNALNVPVGEKINHKVGVSASDAFEIVPGVSGVVVVEVESGTWRCRAGALTSRILTADPVTNKLTVVSHPYREDDGPLRVSNAGGALPAGLVADTDYFVRDVDGDEFKLTTSKGRSPVDITTAGSGNNSIGGDQGSGNDVGFDPQEPITDVNDFGAKKLRTNELQVFDTPVTLSPITGAGDVLTYWQA